MRFTNTIWRSFSIGFRRSLTWLGIISLGTVLILTPACGDGNSITQIEPDQEAVSVVSDSASQRDGVETWDPEAIDALDPEQLSRATIQGNIQRLPLQDQLAGFWTVGGTQIRVNDATNIQVNFPLVGTPVTISGLQVSTNLILATLIQDTVFSQIDRMGIPAILTVFIPPNPFEPSPPAPMLEDVFNLGVPANDQRDFRGEIVNTLEILFSLNNEAGDDPTDDPAQIQGLADALLPDVLNVQLLRSTGFAALNGRNLEDDVIDIALGLITEGACTSDLVENDSIFLTEFPYFGVPN